MLKVYIPPMEFFDPSNEMFYKFDGQMLTLEHSLVSISKWESKWKIPFLSEDTKTNEQSADYIRCMTLTQNVDPLCYKAIPVNVLKEVQEYIDDPMTATTFFELEDPEKPKNTNVKTRKITSELIYYWMVAFNIPFDPCQKWHFNRLMTLIRIAGEKNKPETKADKEALARKRKLLNAQRKAKHHTRG